MACRDVWNTSPSGLRSPQNPPASPSGFVLTGGPRAMYFTHHGKPWLKPIITHVDIVLLANCVLSYSLMNPIYHKLAVSYGFTPHLSNSVWWSIYNTLLKQKYLVLFRNTWFDTKMPCSTQKCPTQHASVGTSIIKHPFSLPSRKMYFFNFILLSRTHTEMKMKLYWYSNIFDIIIKCEMQLVLSICDEYNICILVCHKKMLPACQYNSANFWILFKLLH